MVKNRMNVVIYKCWAPLYDSWIGKVGLIHQARKRSLAYGDFRPGQKVLLNGVGTGLDLPYLPKEIDLTAVDLSPDMLLKARAKWKGHPGQLIQMNAERLEFADDSFDQVVLHLILSVVEHPEKAFSESVRVVRPGGRLLIMDKFLPVGRPKTRMRRLINGITTLLGTDINRTWQPWAEGLPVQVEKEEDVGFGGHYKIVVLRKTEAI